jgi:L-ascorbate metabolism protein UlaG (beta-lactamase superfamily)
MGDTAMTDRALTVRYLGGPTAILELAGLRLVVDPTFDAAGDHPVGNRVLTKTLAAVVGPEEVGPVDAVLLSHDQHPDNLDRSGREYLATVPLVLSTGSAQSRLGGTVRALPNGAHLELPRPDGGTLRITGVPAQHGPDGTEHLVGEVTGFVLTGDGLPTVYVSGDNASLEVVRAIADEFGPFDVALLFAGGAQTPLIPDGYLTLTSEQAAQAAVILNAAQVVPLHFEGWAHFTQGADTLLKAFEGAGLADRLHLLQPGDELTL